MHEFIKYLTEDELFIDILSQEPAILMALLKILNKKSTILFYSILLEAKTPDCLLAYKEESNKRNILEIIKFFKALKLIHRTEYGFIEIKENVRKNVLKTVSFLSFEYFFVIIEETEKQQNKKHLFEKIIQSLAQKCKDLPTIFKNIFNNKEIISNNNEITNKGFEFLLKNKKEQMWIFIFECIKIFYNNQNNLKLLCLKLISELVLIGKNKRIKTQKSLKEIQDFLNILDEVGIIESFENNEIIINPMIDSLIEEKLNVSDRYLILESNYNLYAYTNNKMTISILNLFGEEKDVFTNLVIFEISENSVKKALKMGITGYQIIEFLDLRMKKDCLSDSLKDQILVWEEKTNRIYKEECYVYKDFDTYLHYSKTKDYITNLKGLIYYNDSKMFLISKFEYHDQIKRFLKHYNI